MSLPLISPELTLLRAGGQRSKVYAAIFKPSTVYSARLASLPSSFDKVFEISFTSGSGTLADVKKDMDLWVGSAAGKHDLGIARIRKVPISGTFYISEESDVRWQTSCYLTVANYFDLHARHIRVVNDTTFFMDYDVTYSNQHSSFDPIPRMGGHRVLKKIGSSVSSLWSGSASSVIGSSISSYAWSCATASSSSGMTTATPTFGFNTLGWHLVYLTVTAANGKTATGVRYVYVYDKDHLPEPIFDIGNPSVDYETGGWSFEFSMTSADVADVPDRALVILFREDFYGSTEQSIGALGGCENIECVGKISEESLTINPEQASVTFRVQGWQYWFQKIMGYPSGLQQVTTTPASWVEMQSLTVDKALFHFFHWRTTATVIMDVYPTDDARLASELSSPATNLWSQIQEFSFNTILARPGVDRFGRLFVRIDPQCVPEADRDFPVVMTIEKEDWEPPIQIDRVTVDETGQIDLSGISVNASNSGIALFSLSPGHVMKHYGTIETIDRLLLENQSLSNEQAGLLLAWRDNEYPAIEMPMKSNNPVFDCFPPQYAQWSLAVGDNARGISIDGSLIPRHVERRIEAESGFIQTVVTFELATTADAVNTIVGDVPGSGDTSSVPGVPHFPPLPPFPVILPGDIPGNPEGALPVLLRDASAGFVYSLNGDVSSPNWLLMNGGLTPTQYANANGAFICPNGAVYVFRCRYDDNGFIARAPALGGTFVIVEDSTSIKAKYGAVTTGVWGVAYNPLAPESVAYIIGTNGTANLYYGSGTSFTQGIALPNLSNNGISDLISQDFVRLSYGFGNWLYTGRKLTPSLHEHYWVLSNTSIVREGTFASLGLPATALSHMRPGSTGIIYVVDDSALKYYLSTDNFTSFSLINVVISTEPYQGATIDLIGVQIMNRYDSSARRGKSNDGGSSYSTMPSLPVGNWFFEYAGGSGSSSWWYAASGSALRLSKNFGSTWLNAEGDITSSIPIPSINLIRIGGVTA